MLVLPHAQAHSSSLSVSGTGSSLVIPPSQSFTHDIPLHFSYPSHSDISTSVLPQGMQNASADQTVQRSQRPLISFDSNASITALLHFSASNYPQGMPPLSFPSPIPRAPNPHSNNFISPYLLLPPLAPMQQGIFLLPYHASQGGVPPPTATAPAIVPQGNMMHAQPNSGPVYHLQPFSSQPFFPQIQYYNAHNASLNSSNHNYNNVHSYNPDSHQLQQPVPPLMAPVVLNLRSLKSSSLSSSTLSIILTLSETKDWTTWNNAVVNVVCTINGLGHLFEGQSNDPLLQLAYPPPLPQPHASATDWQAYLEYWQLDALVVQILTAKLGTGPAAHIPSATKIATQRHTARQIYQMLLEHYLGSDYADGLVQKMKLWDFCYTGGL